MLCESCNNMFIQQHKDCECLKDTFNSTSEIFPSPLLYAVALTHITSANNVLIYLDSVIMNIKKPLATVCNKLFK
jgi:hypothetical protein